MASDSGQKSRSEEDDWRSDFNRPDEKKVRTSLERLMEVQNKHHPDKSFLFDYFVLNMQWGPSRVWIDNSSPRKLLDYVQKFRHRFTVHNFRLFKVNLQSATSPTYCDPDGERGAFEEL